MLNITVALQVGYSVFKIFFINLRFQCPCVPLRRLLYLLGFIFLMNSCWTNICVEVNRTFNSLKDTEPCQRANNWPPLFYAQRAYQVQINSEETVLHIY